MARRKLPKLTPFGCYIAERYKNENNSTDFAVVAEDLGFTTAYVRMLANGDATPKLAAAGNIERWSKGVVTMQGWLPWARGYVS